MTSVKRQETVPARRAAGVSAAADDLRRMVLLLETAAVLESRARRRGDPAQVGVLLRRARRRRREAAELRERLRAQGAAQALSGRIASTPTRPPAFRSSSAAGRVDRSASSSC
jgi:hypothetical protein